MLFAPDSLFGRLRAACRDDWRAYVEHPFVRGLGDGTLPEPAFRRYLVQDWLFLVHFARAYALAAYKGETLEDIRAAKAGLAAIVDVEMGLHVAFCAGWGIGEAELRAEPEAPETMAYTRYVLEAGNAGDLLDLHVALAPCVVGYAEIGAALAGGRDHAANPYRAWIEMYAGDEFQEMAHGAVATLDRLMARRGGEGRWPGLVRTFAEATRLEARFWDMGLAAAGPR